jgi:DNA-binding CsgD family transcriptional regulator
MALDVIAEIPDMPDVSVLLERVGDVVARFGFDELRLAETTADGRPLDGRVLLVGWNRAALTGRSSPGPTTAPAPRAPEDFARLEPRRRRRSAEPAAPDPSADPDRWAIVSLLPDDTGLDAVELATLRLLARTVETRLAERRSRRTATGRSRPLLSRRERECLQWTAAGKTTWEIAGILAISPNTIDGYISSAAEKLDAVNRTQAVAEALRRGFID